MPRIRNILLLLTLLIFSISLQSQTVTSNTVEVNPGNSIIPVSGSLLFYRDKTCSLELNDIVKPEFQGNFSVTKGDNPLFTASDDILWARLELSNSSAAQQRFFFLDYYQLYKIDFFIPDSKGSFKHIQAGRFLPFDHQPFKGRHIVIPAQIPSGNSVLFIRIEHSLDTFAIPLYLTDQSGLISETSLNSSKISIYFALIVVFVLYNMVIFFVIREKSYLYYSLGALATGILFTNMNGIPDAWLDKAGYNISYGTNEYFSNLASFFSLLFSIEFLQIKKRSGLVYRTLVVFATIIFINMFFAAQEIKTAQNIWSLVVMTGSFVQITFALRYARRDPYAAFYSVAWGIYLTTVILYLAESLGLHDTGIRIDHIIMASTTELFILAIALGYKFTSILNEKRQMEQTVHKVLEREGMLVRYSYLDPLTETYNRRKFDEDLARLLKGSRAEDSTFSFILADIDHFKKVNDTFGHDIGDHVLISFVKAVKKRIRKSDKYYRLGGEEFGIIAEGCGRDEAVRIAENLRAAVEQECVIETNHIITVSCGVTEHIINDTSKSILKRADKALYRAKDNGRNRVETE